MATNEFNEQFRLNEETIARFAGFAPLPKVKTCPVCDEDNGCVCMVCGMEISEKSVNTQDHHCIDCWNDLQWSLKH